MLDDKDESAIWDDEWVTWAAIATRRADESRQWFAILPPAEEGVAVRADAVDRRGANS